MSEIPLNPDIPIGTAVEVYWNLHRHVFSVRDRKSRRVLGHCDQVFLNGVEFYVSQAGRQRVLDDQRKNVHAFVRGVISARRPTNIEEYDIARYNPYEGPHFNDEDGLPLKGAAFAWLVAQYGSGGVRRGRVLIDDPISVWT